MTTWYNISGSVSSASGQRSAMSKNGLVVAIGDDPNNSVKVFVRSTIYRDNWSQRGSTINSTLIQSLFSITLEASEIFGASLALSNDGNTIAIGSPGFTSYRGRTFILFWNGSAWEKSGTSGNPIVSIIDTANEYSGISLKLSDNGTTLAIGESGYLSDNGTVRIFNLASGAWTEDTALRLTGPSSNSYFGSSIDLSDDFNVLVVGTPYLDTTQFDSGGVYVYSRTPPNAWVEQRLIRENNVGGNIQSSSAFGFSVACSADGLTIFIHRLGSASPSRTNKVYACRLNSSFTITSSNDINPDGIFNSLIISTSHRSISASGDGNRLVVGVSRLNSNVGAGYVLAFSGGTWSLDATLAFSGYTNQGFEPSMSDDGATVILSGSFGAVYSTIFPNQLVGWVSTNPPQLGVSHTTINNTASLSRLSISSVSSLNNLAVTTCSLNTLNVDGVSTLSALQLPVLSLNNLSVTSITSLNNLNVSGLSSIANPVFTNQLNVSGVLSVSGSELIPPGTILWHGRSTAPSGWLFCDGSSLATGTYSRLFSIVSYTWGSGTGTFNLPDLRGNFIRGWVSSVTGILTTSQTFGSLNSATTMVNGAQNLGLNPPLTFDYTQNDNIVASQIQIFAANANVTSGSQSSTGRRFNMHPRNIAMLPVIKF